MTGQEDESTLVIWGELDQIGVLELVLDRCWVLFFALLFCVALLYELGFWIGLASVSHIVGLVFWAGVRSLR